MKCEAVVRGRAVRASLLALLLMVSAACTAGPPDGPPSPSPRAWVPRNAYEQVLDRIGPDGQLSFEDSLALFATVYGPLPGVDVVQDRTGVHDGTLAISAVMRYRDQLSPEQLAAVDKVLERPEGAEVFTVAPAGTVRSSIRLAAAVPDELKQALLDAKDQFRETIANHLGNDVSGEMTIVYAPASGQGGGTAGTLLGQAWSDWPGGRPAWVTAVSPSPTSRLLDMSFCQA